MKTDEIKNRVAVLRKSAFVKGSPRSGWEECREYAEGIDAVVKEVAGSIFEGGEEIAIVATGGYGRMEMSPQSDCDIRIILGSGEARGGTENFMRFLRSFWDSGIKLTFSMGTAAETIAVSLANFRTLTSLFDARLVWGDNLLFERTVGKVMGSMNDALLKGFYDFILLESNKRRKMYGDSTYLVQPNIKLSPGGLRDFNSMRWIAGLFFKCCGIEGLADKGVVSRAVVNSLNGSAGNLLKIRNMLHVTAGFKTDQLAFDLQLAVSRAVGFQTASDLESVEKLMKIYCASAREIALLFSILLKRVEIAVKSTGKKFINFSQNAQKDFEGFMEVAALAAENNMVIHPEAEIAAIEILHGKGGCGMTTGVRRSFYRILLAPEDKGEILMRLLELGVLARLIPQLGDIESLYRRDLYHFFTVDVHTVKGIYFLKRLADSEFNGEFRLARKIFADFGDDERKMLFLAILFHDAGKGGGSGGHSERGAVIASEAAKSLDLKNGEIELITYLVRNHLLLSNSSRTRDIYDARVINEIAETVKNREELDQLYLLTAADMSSVAPHGSTGWSRSLLNELYVNLLKKIEEGINASEDKAAVVAKRREEFQSFAAGRRDAAFSSDDAVRYFSTLPARYFLYADTGTIFEHFALLKRAEREEVVVDVREISHDYYEIVLVAKDSAGLLYRVTGVFLLNALTIMEARIFSGSNGVILDIFKVRDISGNCLSIENKRAEFIAAMKDAATGFEIIERVRKRFSAFIMGARVKRDILKSRVKINNAVSDDFTVVTVKCADRVGLLHSLTEVFYNQCLSISLAIIVTEGSLAMDTFYVEKVGGGKVIEEEAIERLKAKLIESL